PQIVDIQLFLDDYRSVDGVMLPHHLSRSVDGKPNEEITVKTIRINPPFMAEAFTARKRAGRAGRAGWAGRGGRVGGVGLAGFMGTVVCFFALPLWSAGAFAQVAGNAATLRVTVV